MLKRLIDWLFPVVCYGHRFHAWSERQRCTRCPVVPWVGACCVQTCLRCGVEYHFYPPER